ERAPPGATQERQANRDGHQEREDEGPFSDVEPEHLRPVPLVRGCDAEADGGERGRGEHARPYPLAKRSQVVEDDGVSGTPCVEGDERERRPGAQPDDHAPNVKRHEQAVAGHLVPLSHSSKVGPARVACGPGSSPPSSYRSVCGSSGLLTSVT